MLMVWKILNKLLAPLAPALLILVVTLGVICYILFNSRVEAIKDVATLQNIVQNQTQIITSCRDDKIAMDNVLNNVVSRNKKLAEKSCSSVKTLHKLAIKPATTKAAKEGEDYEVLNSVLGDATVRLLNEAASASDR